MQKTCSQCRSPFEITDEDLAFYDKVSPVIRGKKFPFPLPTHCPDCRLQRLLVMRNERVLYHRKCDRTGKNIISMYSSGSPFKVYENDSWWSDEWEAMDYGREMDFSAPFFPQFESLSHAVPRIALLNVKAENSPYCNFADVSKNCHLVVTSNFNEDCFYCTILLNSRSCCDCLWTVGCELCYECVDVAQCYRLRFSRECSSCSDSLFLYNCKGCSQCIGCVNLRQKNLHIFNRAVTQEAFEAKLRELETRKGIENFREECEEFRLTQPHPHRRTLQCEQVEGDHLTRCNNLRSCFDGFDSEDCAYVDTFARCKSCIDCLCIDGAELSMESTSLIGFHNCFTAFCRDSSDIFYSWDCHSCHDLFGCVGLRHKQYCILNKQYSREEYEKSLPKIIEKMQNTAEWGEFFPITMSPFAYNETIANEHFPMTEKQIKEKGWRWKEKAEEEFASAVTYIPASALPDSIEHVSDDDIAIVVRCSSTQRPFKIIKQELDFYRKLNIPLPQLHPEERHRERRMLRSPHKLWSRHCSSCQKAIETTYAPDRPETVYCEECYLKEVY